MSFIEITNLPNDVDELKSLLTKAVAEIQEKDAEIKEREKDISLLLEKLNSLRRRAFAPSSEAVDYIQQSLFNEAEILAQEPEPEETEIVESEGAGKKRRGKRSPLPDHLPRRIVVIELPESERVCPHTGVMLVEIGEEVSEKLNLIPAKAEVIRTIRKIYGLPGGKGGVKTAPVPECILPKSIAAAGLIAFILVSKYADGLPLYRLEQIFKRINLDIARQTMARWVIEVALKMMPLYNLLQDRLLEPGYVQMDETPIQVLKEKDKKPTTKSYMWVRHRPGPHPIVLYDYSPTRSGDNPTRLLEGFRGYLQVDGYDGYAPVTANGNIIRLGCWDHCRRKFFDAFKSSGGKSVGKKGITFIKKLYEIEKTIKGQAPEVRFEVRQTKAKPVIEEMEKWLEEVRGKVLPTSLGGKAIMYARNEWVYLKRYLDDGVLEIANIAIENAIRPFAIGRKNWLFCDSVAGAEASAMIYSLVETAKKNGLNPFDYLKVVLEKLPQAKSADDIEKLLPFRENFAKDEVA